MMDNRIRTIKNVQSLAQAAALVSMLSENNRRQGVLETKKRPTKAQKKADKKARTAARVAHQELLNV